MTSNNINTAYKLVVSLRKTYQEDNMADKENEIEKDDTEASKEEKPKAKDKPVSKKKSDSDKEEVLVKNSIEINPKLEEENVEEAILNFQQRRQRAMTMRRHKAKIAAGRKRAAKKVATKEKLQKRARKKAIQMIRKMVAGKKGVDYKSLNPAEKMMIDKKVAKRSSAIERIAKKMMPKVRRAEMARVSGKKLDEEFNLLFERQDPDIKDREGTQPAKYHAGLSKSTKEKRDAHFKKGAKMDDDNPSAYKPAPGDADAKTKESQYTKKYKAMYGEEVTEASKNDETPKKRYHEARKKDGSIKLDRRFRAFKKPSKPMMDEEVGDAQVKAMQGQHKKEREKLSQEHEREMDRVKTRVLRKQIQKLRKEEAYYEEFESDADVLEFIEQTANDIWESIELEEEKNENGLKAKAEKSGISYSILKKVYDRGVAAWRTGHRPGTTPQQWGFARVNSFITGGKTRTTADADLWKQHKGVSEAVSPAQQAAIAISKKEKAGKPGYDKEGKRLKEEDDPCWDGYKQLGMKKKNGKEVPNCVKEEVELDSFFDLNESFELAEAPILDKALAAIHKHVSAGADLSDMSFQVSRAKDVNISAQELRRKYLDKFGDPRKAKRNPEVAARLKRKFGFKEEAIDEEALYAELDEDFAKDWKELNTPQLINKLKSVTVSKKKYDYARQLVQKIYDRKKEESGGKNPKHGIGYYAAQIAKQVPGVDSKILARSIEESFGAGFEGTDTLIQNYKEQTPGEKGSKKKPKIADWSPNINEDFEQVLEEGTCDLIGIKQIKEFEKLVDRLFAKFGIDFQFTKHFGDRMSDDRNKPCITMKELAEFIKKIYAKQGKSIKQLGPDVEAVIKDMQTDLNIPIVVKYDRRNDEFDVVMKTIMRKKNFKTSNKVINY